MNQQFETVMELPAAARLGISSVILALIGFGYYYFLISPTTEEKVKIEKTIDDLQVQIAERRGIVANLPKFEKEVERLDVELAKALEELPDQREIDQLLARISDKARDAGLDVLLFRTQPESKKEFYAEVPVEIEVMGSYHQVATFFDEVGHLERIVNLGKMAITEPSINEGQTSLKTSVIATAFRFLDEVERPDESDEAEGRRRRRGK